MKRITIRKMVKILKRVKILECSYHLVGAPNENIVQNQLNIALLNVF